MSFMQRAQKYDSDVPTHMCSAAVASISSMVASLAMCIETNAFANKSSTKTVVISIISIVVFMANLMLQKYSEKSLPDIGKHFLNMFCTVLPVILFEIADAIDKKNIHTKGDTFRKCAVAFGPLLVYCVGAFDAPQAFICKTLTNGKHDHTGTAAPARKFSSFSTSSPSADKTSYSSFTGATQSKGLTNHKQTTIMPKSAVVNRSKGFNVR